MENFLSALTNFYNKYRFQILLVVGLRIVYSIWLAIVWILIDQHVPQSEQALWETYHNLSRSPTLLGRAFIDVWLRWDAVHYMNIADFGYSGVGVPDTVFFPLYPYFVGFISKVTTVNVTLVGLLISSLFTIFALIYFYEMIILFFNDQHLAKLSIVLIAIFPTAFFLHAPYTEAMFLCFSIGSIFYVEKKEGIKSGLFACAAGLIRPQGLLLLIPLSTALFKEYMNNQKSFRLYKILSLLIVPLGFVFFSLWRTNYTQTGLLDSINNFSNIKFQDPITTIVKVFISLFNDPSIIRTFEFVFVLVFLFVLIWMFQKKEFQRHLGLLLYSLATWVLITSKTSVNEFAPRLTNRYLLYIFFVFVGFAFLLRRTPEKNRNLIILTSLIASFMFLTLYAFWIYVG